MSAELELRHLRVFLAVIEAGAQARAARVLGISQSTATETISALERVLGVTLFRKQSRRSTLTPAGEALVPYAKRALALTSEILSEVARVSGDAKLTLSVAAVESISTYVLPAPLAAMRERWPSARFRVLTATCDDIRELVAAGKFDVGLIIEAESGANDDVALARARLAICADPAHPLARHAVGADRLVSWDFYMSDAAGSYHEVLRQYFKASEFSLPRMQTLGTIEGVKRGLLAEKTALGVLPAHAVERELREGALVEIIPEPALPGLMLKSVRMPSHGLPLVEDLLTRLRESFSASELHTN